MHRPLRYQLIANGTKRRTRLAALGKRSWLVWSGNNLVLRFIPMSSHEKAWKAKRK